MENKEHVDHTTLEEMKEHNNMSLTLLAEHLGVELYKAMEIARWTASRPKVDEILEPKVEEVEKILIDNCHYEIQSDKIVLNFSKIATAIVEYLKV